MARTESRTKTAIWSSDDDFRNLTARAQRMYWLLYSQPTIGLCGVVALTIKRWAKSAADETEQSVRAALDELVDQKYILVDYDTEEVFVRTFARHDGVARNVKVFAPAWRQLDTIASVEIRRAAEDALWELGNPPQEVVEDMASLTPPTIPGMPYPPVENQPGDTSRTRARAASSPRHCPPPPPLSPPNRPPPADAGRDRVQRTQRDETKRRAMTTRLANICTATSPRTVQTEARTVIDWALTKCAPELVDEAIGWAEHQPTPPVLPRAIAPIVQAKARDKGITLTDFTPTQDHHEQEQPR